ncbi:hypothetical protein JD844_018627 [Phrynosoma platyrhinos]|uniref:C2 domain-containing protein n=1 Tax=Phrynosoma platyrhinos TaxID=52577 RepID=A0ABQ7SP05_PHRPL|nr:hypothetical protein JD844_018627 [Phrynosoma platyrhinos]
MALSVSVKRVTHLPGTGERQVHVSFRGFTQKTKKIHSGQEAVFGEIYIELDLRYQPPDGAAGTWVEEDFVYQMKDSVEVIIRNPGFEELEDVEVKRAADLDRKAAALGRKLVKGLETDDDEDDYYDVSDMEFSGIVFSPVKSRSRIGINITEAQKLVGVNIDPFVVVKIGDEKRHTATQKSTNCPFYNEVFHSKKIPFLGTLIGTFKIDLETVYSQPDHRFYQKWAVINDPKDTRAGVKGFVKCNISVMARGDVMASIPTSSSGQNEDIEKNLLLPRRVPAERPWAKFCIKIYKADGLPNMSAGIMGGFSKIVGEKKVFIDPYVQVAFSGQQGETSVESSTTEPVWNEQISFIEMFPPLVRKIKVQMLDDANIGDVALATHFIDLQQISDPGRNGLSREELYLVTCANWLPCTLMSALHRLMYQLQLIREDEAFLEGTEQTLNVLGVKEEFLLFASFFEVTMMDPLIGTKPVKFEVSVAEEVMTKVSKKGEKGEKSEEKQPLLEASSDDELEVEVLPPSTPLLDKSMTVSQRPEPTEYDGSYSCLPMLHEKPCVYIWSYWEDYTWRLYNSNWIVKIAERLENGLEDVEKLLRRPRSKADERLRQVLEEFVAGCSNNKRVAYTRIPAQNILYAVVEEEKGKDCAKIQTVFLKVPGSRTGEIFAKLEIYMWLGVTKYVKNSTAELPEEFKPIYDQAQQTARIPTYLPPSQLNRDGKLLALGHSETKEITTEKDSTGWKSLWEYLGTTLQVHSSLQSAHSLFIFS